MLFEHQQMTKPPVLNAEKSTHKQLRLRVSLRERMKSSHMIKSTHSGISIYQLTVYVGSRSMTLGKKPPFELAVQDSRSVNANIPVLRIYQKVWA